MSVFEDVNFDLADFERFLVGTGFHLVRHFEDTANFGNILVKYANSTIKVWIICDRSNWTISVADASHDDPGGGFDMGLFQELLFGKRSDESMPIGEKVAFFKQHLVQLLDYLSPDKARDTMSKLDKLGLAHFQRLMAQFQSK
jgi:hypothetical protein